MVPITVLTYLPHLLTPNCSNLQSQKYSLNNCTPWCPHSWCPLNNLCLVYWLKINIHLLILDIQVLRNLPHNYNWESYVSKRLSYVIVTIFNFCRRENLSLLLFTSRIQKLQWLRISSLMSCWRLSALE